MKKLFLATTLLVALTTSSFAGGKNALFNDLKSAAKGATQIKRTMSGDYMEAIFDYNGKTITAFYEGETNQLIGFSVPIGLNELPAGTVEDAQKKYKGWKITDKIIFITSHSRIEYYLQLSKANLNIALFVSPRGKVHFLRSMS